MTAIKILTNIVGQILSAVGYPQVVFRYDVLTAICLPVAFLIACKTGGLWGMGIAWCTVFPLVRFLFLLSAKRILRFHLRAYGRTLLDAVWVSAVSAAVMVPELWLMKPGWERLLLRSMLWALTIAACVFLNPKLRAIVAATFANPFRGEITATIGE